jgi:hypothetical protein
LSVTTGDQWYWFQSLGCWRGRLHNGILLIN